MSDDLLERLRNGLMELDMDLSLQAADQIAARQEAAMMKDAVDAVTHALQVVGKRFQEGEWFLAELVYAGEIAKEIMKVLSPFMQTGDSAGLGTMVIGTVAGDLHDLGKNIVITYARSAGFNVVDLGVDVPTKRFVDAVEEHRPVALGMSCLLTSTEAELGKVVRELVTRGLRSQVKVIIGGAALSQKTAQDISADAFAPDAITGIDIIKGWSNPS
jgi:methanogenic corrinoid protein MtbC1